MTELAHHRTPEDDTVYIDAREDGKFLVGCVDKSDIIRWEKEFEDADAAWKEYRRFAS